MTLAMVYIRQSRHKDYERTASPEVQEEACRALPAVKGCDRVEVLKDLDVSGGKATKRRGYLALLELIKGGSVQVVAAYDQSRAFRNTADALDFYALMEKRPNIEVVFVQGRFDRTAVGGFTYATLAAAHEMERRMTAEKIGATYRHLNTQDKATGQAPYGYRRDRDGGFAIQPDEADIVRGLYADYATGRYSTRQLAAKLNARGIVKPRSRSKGLGWLGDTVSDILQAPAYVAKRYSISTARREGELIPAAWPAIIEPNLFEQVQDMLRRNARVGRSTVRAAYSFSGLLVCAACGRPMRASKTYGVTYYGCRRDVADDVRCPGSRRTMREDRLLPWAEALFQRLDTLRPADFAAAVDAARGKPRQSRAAVEQLDATLERFQKLYLWGHVTEAEYQRERERLEELRADLVTASQPIQTSISLDGLLDAWRSGLPEIRRELLGRLFDALILRDGYVVEYVARHEREAEVVALMDTAFAPRRDLANSGKGGIRTLEGASHPLPA